MECCATCKKRLDLKKSDYSNSGCEDTTLEGFVCLAFASEGQAIWMVGLNEDLDMCECYQQKDTIMDET